MEQRDICQRSIPWLIGYEEAIIEVQSKKSSFAGDILALSCTGPIFTVVHTSHLCAFPWWPLCSMLCVVQNSFVFLFCPECRCVVQRVFPLCPKYGYVLSSVQFVCTWCASGKVAPNGRKFCGKKCDSRRGMALILG